ncbi:MAG: hydroxypyruvate isomerase family protein [Rhodanobacteraceae bacterium]
MPVKQSLCLPCFYRPEMDAAEFCRRVKSIGYPAVEVHDRKNYKNWEKLFATVRAEGLTMASMCGHGTLRDGLNRRENHTRIEAELRESIDVAVLFGIPGLICLSGDRQPGVSDDEGLVICAEVLRRVAPYAEAKGINLNVELLNSKVDHPGYQCDHTAWGVRLCEAVGSPRVKLLYDIYHMQIMEGDIIRTVRKHIQHIGHFHTAGNPGRQLMDDTQELNYTGICKAIADTGYSLYVGHEYGFGSTGDPFPGLKAAFEICRGPKA